MSDSDLEGTKKFKEGLVSVIVPCFNVEKFVRRFLNSLIEQTYKQLEIFLVNDGSTDSTLSIIKDFVPALKDQGYSVTVIDQANAGLAGAVNAGLPHFTGEFLTWPDPDDWLVPNSIEARVAAMRRFPEIGIVRSNANLYNEASGQITGTFMGTHEGESLQNGLFEDLLFTRTFFAPICHFVRSSAFVDANPSRSIYVTPKASQNLQMLLPLVERYPVLRMGEPLGNYCVRPDSRSRAAKTPEALCKRLSMLLDVTENTLERLQYKNPAGLAVVREHYRRNKFLPVTFRGAMKAKTVELVLASDLRGMRRLAAKSLVAVRCNTVFKKLDSLSGRLFSRIFARLFAPLVSLKKCNWPARETGAAP